MKGGFDNSVDLSLLDTRLASGSGSVFFESRQTQRQKTLAPELDCWTRYPEFFRDILVEDAVRCHLYDSGALDKTVRETSPCRPGVDEGAFFG